MQQEAFAGASYIVLLFDDLQRLNAAFANYNNLILYLKSKYKETRPEKMQLEDGEKSDLHKNAGLLRYYIEVVHLKLNALKDAADLNVEELNKKYEEVDGYISDLEIDKVREFVIEANKVFVNSVIQDFLLKAHDIVGRMYGEGYGQQ